MSTHDKHADQQEQQPVEDLSQPQPDAEQEEAEGVKGGMLVIGKAPAGYTGKVVPTMETADGSTKPLT